jgi:hypothetical protein
MTINIIKFEARDINTNHHTSTTPVKELGPLLQTAENKEINHEHFKENTNKGSISKEEHTTTYSKEPIVNRLL